MRLVPDALKLLPDEVRARAIEWLPKLNNDPPEPELTAEKARRAAPSMV
jgi:hypothetical protein